MLVAGHNIFKVLCAESNNNSVKNPPAISPPTESTLDIPSLLSYSVYDEHAILVFRDGRGFVVGNGVKGKVHRKKNSSIYEKITHLIIKDDEGNECNFLSTVCGTWYTFYLLQSHLGDKKFKLAFSYYNTPNELPLFLNLGERNPIALYGGHTTAAALCDDGSAFILTEGMFRTPNQIPPILVLPNNEKIISVGCMEELFIVLSESGKLYKYVLPLVMPQFPPLTEIEDLKGIRIVQLSATAAHCLAVADDGRVFGWGLNESGRIGVPNSKTSTKITTFTEVTALKDYKIRVALAGCYHSLFLTTKGRVLASGVNYDGELMLDSGPSNEDVLTPTKTIVHHGATFGMAGIFLSALFVNCNPPPNSPNYINKGHLPELPDPNFEVKLPKDVEFPEDEENEFSPSQVALGKVKSQPVVDNALNDSSATDLRSRSPGGNDNNNRKSSSSNRQEDNKSGADMRSDSLAHPPSTRRSNNNSNNSNRSSEAIQKKTGQSSEMKPLPSSSSSRASNHNQSEDVKKRAAPASKMSISTNNDTKKDSNVSKSSTNAKKKQDSKNPSSERNQAKNLQPKSLLGSDWEEEKRESTSASKLSMSTTYGEYSEVAGLRQQIKEMKELLDSKDKEIYRLTMLNEALLDNDKSLQNNLEECWDNQQSKIDGIDMLISKKRKDTK